MADWPYNTARWAKLRLLKLGTSPLCEDCEAMGLLTIANTVDHCHPISQGGAAFPSLDGLASLCKACHGAKTARGAEAGSIKTKKPRKGCSIDGLPLDRKHPWHTKKSLRAGAVRPTPNSRIELIGVRPCADPLDDSLDGLWD